MPYDKALDRLTYDHDRDDPEGGAPAAPQRRTPWSCSGTAQARSRKALARRTTGCARCSRPGAHQAAAAGAGAGGVRRHPGGHARAARAASRPSRRTPTRRAGSSSSTTALSEEDATADVGARRWSTTWSPASETSVLCTHRPVLPAVFDALGVADPQAGAGRDARRAPAPGHGDRHRTPPRPLSQGSCALVHVMAVSSSGCLSPTGRFEFTPRSPTTPDRPPRAP